MLIVGWINIILGLLGCISWFFFYCCMDMQRITYIHFTRDQDTATMIFAIIMAIPLILTFIINIIYIFKNRHNKKSMFMNILTIISIILAFTLLFVAESYECMYIISIVALWGILLLIFNKNEDKRKKHRILFGIMITNIILFIISSIGFICVKNDFEIKYTNNEKNLLKNIMQLSEGSNDFPIKAQKNGKWGYINSNGKTVIGFNYDDCSEFMEIENLVTNKKYYIAVVLLGNELKIITNNNKQIVSYKNTKRDRNFYIISIPYDLEKNLKENAEQLKTNIKVNKPKIITSLSYDEYGKEIKYDSNMGYELDDTLCFDIKNNKRESIEIEYDTKTESITYNDRKVSINGKLYIDNDEDYNYIHTYKNGYIPIYNFEKEVFGWIDLKGKTHYISGKKQILDFKGKYIAIKDYSITDDSKVYVADYEGNRVSDYYKEITALDKGYVVKNQNGKNVYLDDNFKQVTQEYDIIDTCRASDGFLIVSNFYNRTSNTDYTYSIYKLSFDLVNINNGKVIAKNFEYISGMSESKYKADEYEDLTDKEYKKILCSVDCDYLNTKLYEQNYE